MIDRPDMRGTVERIAPRSKGGRLWVVGTDSVRRHLHEVWLTEAQIAGLPSPPSVGDVLTLRWSGKMWEALPP